MRVKGHSLAGITVGEGRDTSYGRNALVSCYVMKRLEKNLLVHGWGLVKHLRVVHLVGARKEVDIEDLLLLANAHSAGLTGEHNLLKIFAVLAQSLLPAHAVFAVRFAITKLHSLDFIT